MSNAALCATSTGPTKAIKVRQHFAERGLRSKQSARRCHECDSIAADRALRLHSCSTLMLKQASLTMRTARR